VLDLVDQRSATLRAQLAGEASGLVASADHCKMRTPLVTVMRARSRRPNILIDERYSEVDQVSVILAEYQYFRAPL
jgi:hypothetical protein